MYRLFLTFFLVVLANSPATAPSANAWSTQPGAENANIDLNSRQRCICTRRPARVVRYQRQTRIYRHAALVAVRPIGFNPLPYSFGYYPRPYRYHDRITVVTVRPARYYR